MIKVGDLVKPSYLSPLDEPDHLVGLVVEWDAATDEAPAAGWVLWQGNCDWNIVYEDDIEVIK